MPPGGVPSDPPEEPPRVEEEAASVLGMLHEAMDDGSADGAGGGDAAGLPRSTRRTAMPSVGAPPRVQPNTRAPP